MKCYYEILQVDQEADDGEIKTAYRKLALKWHPDKNLDNTELAKEQFQLVQQAYDVLSDRQERAWYDKHRESILRGANSEYKDEFLDVFQYFTTSCFKGFGDDKGGFYSVYRKVFDQLIEEDMKFINDKDEFISIPKFGNSTSDYEETVRPFYDYWTSYSTKKSFTWLDPHDIRAAGNRRVLKLIEKENEKVRQKAKRERNEEVRNLVAFVRKRDKRVQAHIKALEAKKIENREKQERLTKEKKLRRIQELNDSGNQAEWMKFDNVKSELEEIEKALANQFGDVSTESDDDNYVESDTNNLYCVACNKMFKNANAFKNHESSKKHRENVNQLKQTMLEENNLEMELNDEESAIDFLSDEEEECLSSQKTKKKNKSTKSKNVLKAESSDDEHNLKLNDDESPIDFLSDEEEECLSSQKTKKKNKSRKNKNVLKPESSDDEHDLKLNDEESPVDLLPDEEEKCLPSQKTKKKNKSRKNKNVLKAESSDDEHDLKLQELSTTEDVGNDVEDQQEQLPPAKPKKEKQKKKKAKDTCKSDLNTDLCCAKCRSEFPTKNKLFEHLKKTGHAIFLSPQVNKSKSKKDEKKKC